MSCCCLGRRTAWDEAASRENFCQRVLDLVAPCQSVISARRSRLARVSILSGYVHSEPWVQIQILRAQPSSDPDVVDVPSDLNVPFSVEVLNAVLDIHDASVGHWLIQPAG
jgi:hypothetical protein